MAYFFAEPIRDESRVPRNAEGQLAQAERLFETFTGFAPPRLMKRRVDRSMPEVLVDLGALRGVVYTKDHDACKETFIHFMEDPPRLMCDPDGRQLYVLGGSYRITHRGIEG